MEKTEPKFKKNDLIRNNMFPDRTGIVTGKVWCKFLGGFWVYRTRYIPQDISITKNFKFDCNRSVYPEHRLISTGECMTLEKWRELEETK